MVVGDLVYHGRNKNYGIVVEMTEKRLFEDEEFVVYVLFRGDSRTKTCLTSSLELVKQGGY